MGRASGISSRSLPVLLLIESEVQSQDIYARFTENAELSAFRVLPDEFPHVVLRHSPRCSDPWHLKFRCRRRDVRIEAAAGGSDEIDGNILVV